LKMENIHYNRQMNTKHIRELLLPWWDIKAIVKQL
jgi:hypothetical protein